MGTEKASVRATVVRDLMENLMETPVGHPIQTGEYRMNPIEPAWICPIRYDYELIDTEHFKMEYLRPKSAWTGRVILQLHGGGYIGPMKNTYRDCAVRFSKLSLGSDVLTPDYRVAPENSFPAALEDAITAYRWLLEEKHYAPSRIVVSGDSAGGGLALALLLYLRDHQMPMPAGLIVMSPWTDLTCSGESYQTNFDNDPEFGHTDDNMLHNSAYIGDGNPTDPYMSPVFGSFEGFPPVLLQVGGYEVLLDDTTRVADKLRAAHCRLRLTVYKGMFHIFQMAGELLPESRRAWREVQTFLEIIFGIERTTHGKIVRRVKNPSRLRPRRIHGRRNSGS